jgi:hypothetical protein
MFMGSGGWTISALEMNPGVPVWGAEKCPLQREILLADDRLMSKAEEIALDALEHLTVLLPDEWPEMLANDRSLRFHKTFPQHRKRVAALWTRLVKGPIDAVYLHGLAPDARAIAARLLLARYGFNGNVRISSNGLNISSGIDNLYSKTGVAKPCRIPGLQDVTGDWRQLEIKPDSLVLIDPPYVVPKRMAETHKKLTSCYPGHEPYGSWTEYQESIGHALAARPIAVIVAGYYSEELTQVIEEICDPLGYAVVEGVDHGPLQAQSNHAHNRSSGQRSAHEGLKPLHDYEWRILPMGSKEEWRYPPSQLELTF